MTLEDKLSEFAASLEAAEGVAAAAKQGVHSDKASRKEKGLWPRIVDFFRTTQAERTLEQAQGKLEALTLQAQSVSTTWVKSKALTLLNADPAASGQLQDLADRKSTLEQRMRRVNAFLVVGRNVSRALETAISDCDSASSTELLDMVTSSKTISVLSTLSTSSANDSIQAARSALNEFVRAYPKRGEVAELASVNDTLDLVVDFVLELPLDITSFFSMDALDKAQAKCEAALAGVQRALEPWYQLEHSLEQAWKTADIATKSLHGQFKLRAVSELPARLRVLV